MKKIASAVFGHGHHVVRDWVWRHGHTLRPLRAWRSGDAIRGRVLHVTSSFDLGGTQIQIKHLATSKATRFEHYVTEMFPELNYLYRQDERLDEARYVRGSSIHRAIGRSIMSRYRRGYELVQVAKLARDLESVRPEVVVGWGHEICVTTYLAAAITRTPHVVFCIRTFNPGFGWADAHRAELLRAAHRWMAPRVSGLVANSTELRRDYSDWLEIQAETIMVCENGVSLDVPDADALAAARAETRAALGVPDDEFLIANVARFSAEKGQPLIIRANALLPGDLQRKLSWLLCGDGPTLEQVRELARIHDAANVRFVGRTTRVWEMLAAADGFVMPSDYEGMPNAMMEAMAVGLPCVSTSRSGIRDIARDGIDAFYFEPGDAPALAAHVQWLMENRPSATAMGRSAAVRVREFAVPRFVGRFEDILDRSLGSPLTTAA